MAEVGLGHAAGSGLVIREEGNVPQALLPGESWEEFDAEALFPPPTLHANHLIKVDPQQMTQVEAGQDEMSGDSRSEELGDTFTDAPVDANHVDELFEMDGVGGQADDREIKADTEEDRRTEVPEAEEKSEADGAEKPIQKDSEGVEEVAEATSKTSEDVHGGDEATRDIEDSPNAADNGQSPDNSGAEAGEGGGEGDGEGQSPSDAGQGDGSSDGMAEGKPQNNTGAAGQEDWEAAADQSALQLSLEDSLEELEAKVREEKGHRTVQPSYQFNRAASPAELEIAFLKSRELIEKLAAEEDFTARMAGASRWDAKALTRAVVSYRHPQIPSSRYDRPREADIVLLLDISGSCAQQAEMFMAIAAGAVGNGVRVYVGYNGSARACALTPPKRRPRRYEEAKAWVQSEVSRVSGWENGTYYGEWMFAQFVEEVKPKTLIIFGDWDGIDQYQQVCHQAKYRSTQFFWFANEGLDSWRAQRAESGIPAGWNRKNYFPGVYAPRDLVQALRKVK